MMPSTLTRYLARRFFSTLGMILVSVLVTVLLIDFVEQLRQFSDRSGFTPLVGVQLALMRAPDLFETILPFIVLFAAIATLLNLSRKLELVVARASGVSVWQFLGIPLVIAMALGVFSSLVISPVATRFKERAERIEAELVRGSAERDGGFWFRQSGVDGPSILHADAVSAEGFKLHGVTAFVFGFDGGFREKVTARQASYGNGVWTLNDTEVRSAEAAPRVAESYLLPTNLSGDDLRQILVSPEAVSLWSLPGFIQAAEAAGLNSDRYKLMYHSLLSRPFFLAAMVAIAATVSLRLFRYGGVAPLVLAGTATGFLLYVVTEIVNDLGGNGIISPMLAAWIPALFALTAGATLLLYQEDG
ncbi:MAG TPA: LPS export ABC transporter permease LptG [Afifellaceae bacterium]|nr:LPS export ABC transporter permease LptG [Afifellaceae bacterium]